MAFISNLLRRDPVAAQAEIKPTKVSEKHTIGAVCHFFTENINYLITASLVYFALFAGFARMRSKHLMVAVPAAAVWTVIQAKAWIGTLAVGTTLLGLAQAFFSWQSAGGGATQQATDLAGMAARFSEGVGGARGMASTVADQVLRPQTEGPKHVPSSPFQGVADTVMDQIGSRRPADSTPLTGERTTSLFSSVDQAVEEFEAFSAQGMHHEIAPASPTLSGQQAFGLGEEVDFDALLEEMDISPSSPEIPVQRFDPSDTIGQLQEVLPDTSRASPSHTQELERLWSEASSQRLTPETNAMFESIWQQGLQKAPKDVNAEDWAAEFLVREGKKKGMNFGQIAKWGVGLALAGLTIWGLYKLWCASNEEVDPEEDVREADLEKDRYDLDEYDLEADSGWLGSFGTALSYLVPESDGYGSDTEGMSMLGGGMTLFDNDRNY